MEFQEGSGTLEVSLLLETALGLDVAELVECLSELAGESLGVHAESREGAVGVDDVEADGRLLGGRVGGAVEEGGFEQRDAVEAPRGVGELLGELSFGGSGRLILVEEFAAVALVGGGILCSEEGGLTREAVGDGVLGGALFAGGGARSGGSIGCWWLVVGCWLLVAARPREASAAPAGFVLVGPERICARRDRVNRLLNACRHGRGVGFREERGMIASQVVFLQTALGEVRPAAARIR